MYCTGGIRCDVYSTFLRQHGFKNLYSLEGGVQNYLETEGNTGWNGSLYVFDDRMAVSADQLLCGAEDESAASHIPCATPCVLCGGKGDLPHINCANVDCNLLFIACKSCKERMRTCCCEDCRDNAPRLLRPKGAPLFCCFVCLC
jgi:predicted sulfurtransferase